MSVTFSGLASGVDTASIVESIIEVESAPKTLLENKKEYLETKLETYEEFNTLIDTFYASVLGLNSENDLNSYAVSNAGSEYFSISASSLSSEGSYSVEIVSLAQQQKDVSTSYIADTDTTSLTGELQFGDETLSYESLTLTDLVSAINDGDYGATASMIDDGSGDGYRLMLTADTAGATIEIIGTGSVTLDTATDGHTVDGTRAHIVVDGVNYYSASNTMTSAIKGATITLLAESDDGADKVTFESDAETVISTQLEEMVEAYNAMVTSIDTIYESDPTLANSMKSVQQSLKNYLTGSAMLTLGIESDWETGQLTFDSDVFSEAYAEDADGIKTALMGDDDTDGIMTRMDDYLTEQMSSTTGFLATKESTIDAEVSRLEDSITAMETRLEKRQEMLEAQFSAMETLISSLNSQGDYLTSFFEDYNSSS